MTEEFVFPENLRDQVEFVSVASVGRTSSGNKLSNYVGKTMAVLSSPEPKQLFVVVDGHTETIQVSESISKTFAKRLVKAKQLSTTGKAPAFRVIVRRDGTQVFLDDPDHPRVKRPRKT